MDTEQLKLILDMLKGVGEGTMTAFVTFLIFQFLPKAMWCGAFVWVMSIVKKTVVTAVRGEGRREDG